MNHLPPWRKQTTVHHVIWRMNNYKLQKANRIASEFCCTPSGFAALEAAVKRLPTWWRVMQISPSRPSLKGCSASYPYDARTWRPVNTYQRCCFWSCPVVSAATQSVFSPCSRTEGDPAFSLQDSASTRSRCTQQGGAPRHRRALGGWPSFYSQWTAEIDCGGDECAKWFLKPPLSI